MGVDAGSSSELEERVGREEVLPSEDADGEDAEVDEGDMCAVCFVSVTNGESE